MIRNLKMLGLALVAVFAMGAMTASAASATDLFTAGKSTAWLTGTSHDNVFNIPNISSFECTTSKFTGTVANGASEATVLPSYTGVLNETPHTNVKCNASLGKVTIDVNDCHYKLTGNTTGSDNGTDATVWVECGTEPIVITAPLGCKVKVPSQTPTSGGVTYTNETENALSVVKVTATVTGITYTSENCGGLVPAHGNDATYTGTVKVTGYEDLGTNSTGTEDPLTTPIEGSQIAVSQS